MNDDTPKPPDYSRVLIIAGISSFIAVALTNFYHGSPTLVLCVGIATLLVTFVIGQFVRNRFQLGLRSLILLLTFAAVLMGLFGSRMNAARIQKQAVESVLGLRVAGGTFTDPYCGVRYEYANLEDDFFTTKSGWLLPIWVVDMLGEDFFFAVDDISIQNQDLSTEASLDSVQLEHFSSLYISNCELSDGAVQRLFQQKQLLDLSLVNVELSDEQLAALTEQLPQLTRLHVGHVQSQPPQPMCTLTNEGIRHLAKLSQLTELTLDQTNATGECLRSLAKLPNLQHLGCSGLSMTESDVELLRECKSLKTLTIYDTCIDEEWIPFFESLNLEWVAFTATDESRVDEINNRDGKPKIFVR